MNLQPVHPILPCQERHTLRCLRCRLWFPISGMLADLEGPAFVAYYCPACAPLAAQEEEAQPFDTAPVDSGRPDRDVSQGRARLVPVTHYALTLEEHQRERGSYVDPDRYKPGHRDYQPEMLCHTGDGHARGTRNKAAVTCPACLSLLQGSKEGEPHLEDFGAVGAPVEYQDGEPVEVLFPDGWHDGIFLGFVAGGVDDEGFRRVDVKLAEPGRVARACHPDCVRRPFSQEPAS